MGTTIFSYFGNKAMTPIEEVIPEDKTPSTSPLKRKEEEEIDTEKKHKIIKVATPETSVENVDVSDDKEKKEAEKAEKIKKKEEDRLKKEQEKRVKEEEKLRKEQERKLKEEERLKKQKQREEEKLKKEQEKVQREEARIQKQRERELERELKKKRLDEEKASRERKKEEEKKKREEEKLRKEKEKEERERLRLERKQQQEDEKKKKDEERKKAEESKERSQMKISNFFRLGPKKDNEYLEGGSEKSDVTSEAYHKMFLPFFVKKNVILHTPPKMESKEELDSFFNGNAKSSLSLKDFFSNKKTINEPRITSEDVVNVLNSSTVSESHIYDTLQKIPPIKYIQFYENAGPPYIGTWFSQQHQSVKFPTTDPFHASTGLDYSYDSDIDWNGDEEGEGEDIDNEEEEEDEDEDEDEEMDDFVETENKSTRKMIGPLMATSKWNDGSDAIFEEMGYHRLNVNIDFAIDPYFDYWNTDDKPPSPLKALPRKVIEDKDVLKELIQFIQKNNDFTLGTLVELCKKEFKTFTKAIIKHTIQEIASYNKKTCSWEVKPMI